MSGIAPLVRFRPVAGLVRRRLKGASELLESVVVGDRDITARLSGGLRLGCWVGRRGGCNRYPSQSSICQSPTAVLAASLDPPTTPSIIPSPGSSVLPFPCSLPQH